LNGSETHDQSDPSLNSGSRWHRWEPHVHAPGTLLNNQFSGEDPWGEYLTTLEASDPPIRAVAVTDYYLTNTYEDVVAEKGKGRLPDVDLIFPNVELRLLVGTMKGRWVNVHLLVDPTDPEHLVQLHRFLGRLRFRAHGDTFACTRDDLIRLGKAADTSTTDDGAALRHGAGQFKVSFDQLREEFDKFDWARENILVAVAGGQTDGTSGVRDAADTTLRQEMEKFADVIFASSVAQREFWLGLRDIAPEQLRARYRGLKPCLHGSDGHDIPSTAKPDGDRFSWVKGALKFDTLRQACIDPAGRAYVGEKPPIRATPTQVISTVEFKGAPWAATPRIALNPGLVAIIGARGSGKTALADAIAAGCDATSDRLSDASFLVRAREHLGGAGVKLEWGTGAPSERPLVSQPSDPSNYARARYLSQKFVEELCSADRMTDELLREIQRVIFDAHSDAESDGTANFDELLELRTEVLRSSRSRDEDATATLSDRISQEQEKRAQIATLRSQIEQKRQLIANYTKNRDALVATGSEERISRLTALTAAADQVRGHVRGWTFRHQTLRSLQDDVADFRTSRAPETLREAKESFSRARLTDEEWEQFKLKHEGDVDGTLGERLKHAQGQADAWRGKPQPPRADDQIPYLADDADLPNASLTALEAEIGRIQKLINVDSDTAKRYQTISARISDENAALERLTATLEDCEQADGRIRQLQTEREATYIRVFESILTEEQVLHDLYRPLMDRLTGAEGTLNKLSFSVTRHADIQRWAKEGEGLFDLRRQGPFKGVGTLELWAEATLRVAWETGDPQAVAAAMVEFRNLHQAGLLDLAVVPKAQQADYRSWLRRFAKWLFGTSHIEIRYSIDYEGVDIRKLSPGTRGIVLLLLYLALDDADDRPLIIDQPEENLDPKSIFDELVGLFIAAKGKRQVIMVTHNANLVVNTDADQVIVAFADTHTPGKLPPIRYISGGLESEEIRTHVCDILEGGEDAFKERARRLRVWLDRSRYV
jgi:hypothetical protein